jgi:hypothetical protein
MTQPRDGARFTLEALLPLLIAGQMGRQNLDRHLPVQQRIARSINLPHSPGTDECEDLVMAKPSTFLESHR